MKENIKGPRHWSLWGEFTGDRWKCFHLMTSSWYKQRDGGHNIPFNSILYATLDGPNEIATQDLFYIQYILYYDMGK